MSSAWDLAMGMSSAQQTYGSSKSSAESSSKSDYAMDTETSTTSRPPEKSNMLAGAVMYFDVYSKVGCSQAEIEMSSGVDSLKRDMQRLGAKVVKRSSASTLTHLIFSDGHKSSLNVAKERTDSVKLVSPLWAEECVQEKCLVDETPFLIDLEDPKILLIFGQRRKKTSLKPSDSDLDDLPDPNSPMFSSTQRLAELYNDRPKAAPPSKKRRKRSRSTGHKRSRSHSAGNDFDEKNDQTDSGVACLNRKRSRSALTSRPTPEKKQATESSKVHPSKPVEAGQTVDTPIMIDDSSMAGSSEICVAEQICDNQINEQSGVSSEKITLKPDDTGVQTENFAPKPALTVSTKMKRRLKSPSSVKNSFESKLFGQKTVKYGDLQMSDQVSGQSEVSKEECSSKPVENSNNSDGKNVNKSEDICASPGLKSTDAQSSSSYKSPNAENIIQIDDDSILAGANSDSNTENSVEKENPPATKSTPVINKSTSSGKHTKLAAKKSKLVVKKSKLTAKKSKLTAKKSTQTTEKKTPADSTSKKKTRKRRSTPKSTSSLAENPKKKLKIAKKLLAFSSVSDSSRDIILSTAKVLGEFKVITDPTALFTHLITERGGRTLKLLFALARGAWILDPAWVYVSLDARAWADERVHVSSCFDGCKRSREMREKSDYKGLLHGISVFLDPLAKLSPKERILEKLVLTAGGRLVDIIEKCDVCISTSDSDQSEESAKPVVRVDWLFESLTCYKILPYAGFLLHPEDPELSPSF
eukprot:889613_1